MMLVPALALIGPIALTQRQDGRFGRDIAFAASVLRRLTRVIRIANLYRMKRRDTRLVGLAREYTFEPKARIE